MLGLSCFDELYHGFTLKLYSILPRNLMYDFIGLLLQVGSLTMACMITIFDVTRVNHE